MPHLIKNRSQKPRVVVLSFLLIGLSACSLNNSLLEEYTTRLARTLDVDRPEVSRGELPVMPRQRDLRMTATEASIDLLDFLALGDCELQSVVAEKNSSLGRVATPLSNLIYELRFLSLAEICAEQISTNEPELAEQLAEVVGVKTEELPAVIFSALLGGEEFRAFWRLGTDIVIDAEVITAMRGLNSSVEQWLSGHYEVDQEKLVEQLQVIEEGQGGDYLRYWFDLERYLIVADQIVDARMSERPLCFENMKTGPAKIFRNVVMQFFIGGVQKEVAVVSRGSFDLYREVDELEAKLSAVLPQAYLTWQSTRRSIVTNGSESMSRHVKSLETPMMQCGFLSPPSFSGDSTL